MKKELKLPFKGSWHGFPYVFTQSSTEGEEDYVDCISLRSGEVYTAYKLKSFVISLLETGDIVAGQGYDPIVTTDVATTNVATTDVATLSLKVETDASQLTSALAAANQQATELEATLERIKNIFNK